MTTRILSAVLPQERAKAVAEAVKLLSDGGVVALPTETVYGLAADALNPDAALKIFEAQERPRFDPLIVHLANVDWLERVADVPDGSRELVERLTQRFWPGPLTLVLPRRNVVPDVVTAGLDTVAVRVSAHPVFGAVVTTFGKPLAAPSANRFGNVSPTAAEHARAELDGRIELIIDGGATTHGVESTIVSVSGGRLSILRPGPVTFEQLSRFGEVAAVSSGSSIQAPGQLPSHYAPRTPLILTQDIKLFVPDAAVRAGALCWANAEPAGFSSVRRLSPARDLREAAANLFRYLRELDAAELDFIVAEEVPDEGLGAAIMDRLRRASAKR